MKKRVRLLLIATIPVLVFANVYQSYVYERIGRTIVSLESQQKNWLEENKRIIAGIAVLSAPERIEQIATKQLGMTRHDLAPVLRIKVPGKSGNEG